MFRVKYSCQVSEIVPIPKISYIKHPTEEDAIEYINRMGSCHLKYDGSLGKILHRLRRHLKALYTSNPILTK